jgi:hypothetical protein
MPISITRSNPASIKPGFPTAGFAQIIASKTSKVAEFAPHRPKTTFSGILCRWNDNLPGKSRTYLSLPLPQI